MLVVYSLVVMRVDTFQVNVMNVRNGFLVYIWGNDSQVVATGG